MAERVLNAEMEEHHLAGEEPGNRRNGYGKKTVITDTGQIELAVPRTARPASIRSCSPSTSAGSRGSISMYARGMSSREIVGHLRDLYGIAVSPNLISAVTDAVLEEVAAWQARPLEAIYPLVFFDALRVKIRDEGLVRNKAVYNALGMRADSAKNSWSLGSDRCIAPKALDKLKAQIPGHDPPHKRNQSAAAGQRSHAIPP